MTTDQVFRINCFADGVGVMLAAILTAIGIHGLCVMPPAESRSRVSASTATAGVAAVLLGLMLCVYVIGRVGSTNALRQAIARSDADAVRAQIRSGSDVKDAFWWGQKPLNLARRSAGGKDRELIIRMLRGAGARE